MVKGVGETMFGHVFRVVSSTRSCTLQTMVWSAVAGNIMVFGQVNWIRSVSRCGFRVPSDVGIDVSICTHFRSSDKGFIEDLFSFPAYVLGDDRSHVLVPISWFSEHCTNRQSCIGAC